MSEDQLKFIYKWALKHNAPMHNSRTTKNGIMVSGWLIAPGVDRWRKMKEEYGHG